MNNQSPRLLGLAALTPIMLACASASAQSFEVSIDSKASNASLDSTVIFDASGILIGDYDADTNPTGTQTRAGFFGGSGNQPIDTSVSFDADTVLDTLPAGDFVATPDFDGLTIEIEDFVLDLLNGQPGGTDLAITMLYDTFHTVSPSFVYPGGVPITLPIGQVGGITEASLTQAGPGAGTLSPTDQDDVYDLLAVVPALLDLSVSQSLPGSDPTETPISVPIALPIAGTLEVLGDGSIVITIEINPDPVSTLVPIEGIDLPEIPFGLPTFGAETASVLFTLSPESVGIDALLSMNLFAVGNKDACPADLTGDGNLNFFDVSAFLSAFAAMDPIADFTGDGEFNFFDVSAFLSAFADGCP